MTSLRVRWAYPSGRPCCGCARYSLTPKVEPGLFAKVCHAPITSMCAPSASEHDARTALGGCALARQYPPNADIVGGMKPASHRDQLVAMLCEAAEVEHCLMCTYLYGAFSLKQRTDEDLTEAELQAIRRWRATVIDIAIDEMLHLALVNNLLISLGAIPHYGRYNFPINPGVFPAD